MSQGFVEGGCLCGTVRYRVRGEPVRVTHCHCLDCRRSSGAAFVTWAEFALADFVFSMGEPAQNSSAPGVLRTFCRRCGTPLTYLREGGETIDVTVCSMDDPTAVSPQDHIWTVRQLPWVRLDDALPRHDRGRDEAGEDSPEGSPPPETPPPQETP